MKIIQLFLDWRAGKLVPNKRQEAVLILWGTFLAEHPEGDYETMVLWLPEVLSDLYELASRETLSGPVN
jgi:hypothetical protein